MAETEDMTIEELREQLTQVKKSQAGETRQYQLEKKRADDLAAELAVLKANGGVAARLDKIESAYASKVHRMEIEYHVRTRAVELGLDRDVLEGLTFASTEEAESYLARLSDFRKRVAESEIEKGLLSTQKPRAGATLGAPRYDAVIAKELAGVRSNGF